MKLLLAFAALGLLVGGSAACSASDPPVTSSDEPVIVCLYDGGLCVPPEPDAGAAGAQEPSGGVSEPPTTYPSMPAWTPPGRAASGTPHHPTPARQ